MLKVSNTRKITGLATASYTTLRAGKKHTAIAVCGNVDGKQVQLFSLPAELNAFKLPGLRELRGMLEGRSIVDAAKEMRNAPSREYAAAAQFRLLGRAATVSDIVVIRARFSVAQSMFAKGLRDGVDNHAAIDIMLASWCDDKAVHAMEEAIGDMYLAARAEHGHYADHKAAFAPAPAVSLVKRVSLVKAATPAPRFSAPVITDLRSNGQIMLEFMARLRAGRMAVSTVYTIKSVTGVVMGSYLEKSEAAARDSFARAYGFASFAAMSDKLHAAGDFEVFAEFPNPLTEGVAA